MIVDSFYIPTYYFIAFQARLSHLLVAVRVGYHSSVYSKYNLVAYRHPSWSCCHLVITLYTTLYLKITGTLSGTRIVWVVGSCWDWFMIVDYMRNLSSLSCNLASFYNPLQAIPSVCEVIHNIKNSSTWKTQRSVSQIIHIIHLLE